MGADDKGEPAAVSMGRISGHSTRLRFAASLMYLNE